MAKLTIRTNYTKYEEVKKAFRAFLETLVWNAANIDEGTSDDVKYLISKYCSFKRDDVMISRTNENVRNFAKSIERRYEVFCYECDEKGNEIEETAKRTNTNNEKIALKIGAEFYRNAKKPKVKIYDNETSEYIAEWG